MRSLSRKLESLSTKSCTARSNSSFSFDKNSLSNADNSISLDVSTKTPQKILASILKKNVIPESKVPLREIKKKISFAPVMEDISEEAKISNLFSK